MAELKKGDSFGELSLIYGATRAATVVTSEPSDLIILNKSTYDKVVKGVQVEHIDQVIQFFKNFPVFQELEKESLVHLATKSMYRKFSSNTVVMRQGDEPFSVYFIKSGRFKVYQIYNYLVIGIEKGRF